MTVIIIKILRSPLLKPRLQLSPGTERVKVLLVTHRNSEGGEVVCVCRGEGAGVSLLYG